MVSIADLKSGKVVQVIPSGKSIDPNKLRDIDLRHLSEIRLNSINPPSIANNSINDDIKKIYVPEKSLEKYKSAPIWQNFYDRIVPIETY